MTELKNLLEANVSLPQDLHKIIVEYDRNPTCDEFKNMLSRGEKIFSDLVLDNYKLNNLKFKPNFILKYKVLT